MTSMKIVSLFIILTLSITIKCDAGVLDFFKDDKFVVKTTKHSPENSVPLTWISDNVIAISQYDSIYKYDIATKKVVNNLVTSYDSTNFTHYNCFSPDAAIYQKNKPIRKPKSTSRPNPEVACFITNWNHDSSSQCYDYTNKGTLIPNYLDCTTIDREGRSQYYKQRIVSDKFSNGHNFNFAPVFKASHGDTYLFGRNSGGEIQRTLELWKTDNSTGKSNGMSLILDNNDLPHGKDNYGNKVLSFYDIDQDNYVLFEITSNFDENSNDWPLTAWRVTPDLALVERYILPPGPWVEKHSFLKQMSCFSCGCHCYSHMMIYGNGGKIYAHIYGKAVDNDAAGIYLLSNKGLQPEWVSIYKGNFSNGVVLSPNGCEIFISNHKNKFLQLSVCGG